MESSSLNFAQTSKSYDFSVQRWFHQFLENENVLPLSYRQLYALRRIISWKTLLIKRSLLSILTKHAASSDETGMKGSFIFALDM